MKSKFLKCLSVGITSAMLAASIIPMSAPTASAAGVTTYNNYYKEYKLPTHASTSLPGQGETYYAIFQIASLKSYDETSHFAEYEMKNPTLWNKDNNNGDLLKVDDAGRVMYSTGEALDTWKVLDKKNFTSLDVTMGDQQTNHDLIAIRTKARLMAENATTIVAVKKWIIRLLGEAQFRCISSVMRARFDLLMVCILCFLLVRSFRLLTSLL